MALPISSISLANTFGQWIIVTQNIVTELNALDNNIKNGSLTKNSGTFFINSSGVGLAVANTATFGNIQVANNSIFQGNVSFNRPITVNTTSSLVSGVDIRENIITFSTITPKVDTYISVNRGIGFSNAQMRWLESSKKWQIRNVDSPASYFDIITSNNTATTTTTGIVQLNDDYNSSSTTQAATINAVRKAYNALSGGVSYSIVYDKANSAYDLANTAYGRANAAYDLAASAAGGGISKIVGTTGSALPLAGEVFFTSTNGVTLVGSANTVTVNTPQNLRVSDSPTFNRVSVADAENYFSQGNLFLRSSAAPVTFSMRSTSGTGSFWIVNSSNKINFYSNTSANSTSWNNTAGYYDITTKGWLFNGHSTFANNLTVSETFFANAIGNTTFKNVTGTTYSVKNNETVILGDSATSSTIELPSSPNPGNFVTISVGNHTSTTISRNGSNIMGLSENLTLDIANVSITLIYSGDSTLGWKIV